MLHQFCFTNLNHLQTHPYKSLLLSVFYLSVAVLSVTSYTLWPILGAGDKLHQLHHCVLLHRHSAHIPCLLRLDSRTVTLPASRDGALRQAVAD